MYSCMFLKDLQLSGINGPSLPDMQTKLISSKLMADTVDIGSQCGYKQWHLSETRLTPQVHTKLDLGNAASLKGEL